ncbi:zinc-dependent alcohol dehydrogenase family protein [Allopusillimonas ginsengisoli]|uniref:zinc-dependent alcohol dehydrogenase family protein n=1 Tax=Allopusillimonas ginsengisoli TaxID=453575 RepID=UPI0010209AA7|nr:zinc-dependent alcohol dehydrogenase family protein [Allopusillimonas ginsengisoli]TEA79044.1 quinone oxidoreductase [Allopusillimonas ginsengisoli]
MQALMLKQHGNVDQFELQDIPMPEIKRGYVLIKVAATSVNQVDIKIRNGLPISPALPGPIGCDAAGTITKIGEGVTGFEVGDAVYGCVAGVKGMGGALAEYVLADAQLIAKKPVNLSMREAAAMPLVAITAWEAIERAHVKKGEAVLVHGGMGGVGHIAAQLAVQRGARVFVTVSRHRDDALLRSFGIDGIIDAGKESVEDYVEKYTEGRGFDVVIDTVGGENLDRSLQAAGLNGRVSAIAARSTHDLSPMHAKALTLNVIFMLIPMLHDKNREQHGEILARIARLVEAGGLKPIVDQTEFTLQTAPQAHSHLESGQAHGKVVISVSSDANL